MCDGEDKLAALDGLIQVVEAFVASPGGEITGFELGERLIRLRHGIDLLELRFAHEAAAFASSDEYERQGSTSPIDWVRHQCRMSGGAAARSIATGEALPLLPATVTGSVAATRRVTSWRSRWSLSGARVGCPGFASTTFFALHIHWGLLDLSGFCGWLGLALNPAGTRLRLIKRLSALVSAKAVDDPGPPPTLVGVGRGASAVRVGHGARAAPEWCPSWAARPAR